MTAALRESIAALDPGPLTEESLRCHVFPLFTKTLASGSIYLANHSLGRPLDQTACDVQEALSLWSNKLGDAWDDWLPEQDAFRERIARLIHAPQPDLIVPKTSAGQGLRAVLNALPAGARVVSTRGEFDSIDVILKQYAALGRIATAWTESDSDNQFSVDQIVEKTLQGADLVVVSHVMFTTGQIIHDLKRVADACRTVGARLLVDAYHSVGVFPVDVATLGADFLIGGSYKYLRGGPGACFLYVSRAVLETGFASPDIGWFAKQNVFSYERPDPPIFAAGGNAFLESTPPVLSYYQARSGQEFVLGIGVDRLRAYSLERLNRLKSYLAEAGITATGGDDQHGAFLTIQHPKAVALSEVLAVRNINTDARGNYLRTSPDCLITDKELRTAALAISEAVRQTPA